ncbi:unnamed protein product [Colias eurytheme]|nr:unnamed protein product [Colias eurytheme]
MAKGGAVRPGYPACSANTATPECDGNSCDSTEGLIPVEVGSAGSPLPDTTPLGALHKLGSASDALDLHHSPVYLFHFFT